LGKKEVAEGRGCNPEGGGLVGENPLPHQEGKITRPRRVLREGYEKKTKVEK